MILALKILTGFVVVNSVLFVLGYWISKFSRQPMTEHHFDSSFKDLLIIIGLGSVLFVINIGSFIGEKVQYLSFNPFIPLLKLIDYHFDPKLKSKRIMDKQIQDFQRGIKR